MNKSPFKTQWITVTVLVLALLLAGASLCAAAEQSGQKGELSKEVLAKLAQNPIANLVSIPIQNNFNYNYGPHNGNQYVGNVMTDALPAMVEKSLRSGFGITKETALPRWCRECEVLSACQGGCPKHRFTGTYYDEPGLHYLCTGYKKFFIHIQKYLHVMTQLLENGLPVSLVMEALKRPLVITQGGAGGQATTTKIIR